MTTVKEIDTLKKACGHNFVHIHVQGTVFYEIFVLKEFQVRILRIKNIRNILCLPKINKRHITFDYYIYGMRRPSENKIPKISGNAVHVQVCTLHVKTVVYN